MPTPAQAMKRGLGSGWAGSWTSTCPELTDGQSPGQPLPFHFSSELGRPSSPEALALAYQPPSGLSWPGGATGTSSQLWGYRCPLCPGTAGTVPLGRPGLSGPRGAGTAPHPGLPGTTSREGSGGLSALLLQTGNPCRDPQPSPAP